MSTWAARVLLLGTAWHSGRLSCRCRRDPEEREQTDERRVVEQPAADGWMAHEDPEARRDRRSADWPNDRHRNDGVPDVAHEHGMSRGQLAWCSTWYLREDTLKAAIAQIVNYQHRLALAQFWGGGTLSSSDGQRFPVPVKSRHSTALPRYFGFRRGITHYTWTSDQYSPYGTKVIPSTVRDATYVLDEILDNETELPIEEHTTDTAGYTVIWTFPAECCPELLSQCS